jgi:hypothetical protein
MEEGNKRVLRPYRKYLPTPDWFAFKWRMSKLNSFLINLIRCRWQARQAGKPGTRDILDRILAAIEVSMLYGSFCVKGCTKTMLQDTAADAVFAVFSVPMPL